MLAYCLPTWIVVMADPSSRSMVSISSQSHSYDVTIGSGVVKEQLQSNNHVIVADSRFRPMLKQFGKTECVYVDAVESAKNLSTVEEIIVALQQIGVRRDSTVLAIGGGIVQDVVTLAASLYMRGIQWNYAPTTLLAMADSCIGGKSSINTKTVKNLIGNIYPPQSVFVDTDFVLTLPEADVLGGLAEAAKICFCKSSIEFEGFLRFGSMSTPENLDAMLPYVLDIKKWFIQVDEFDKAERKQLNFGHTFGHALEVGSDYGIPHGLSVASGMRAALFFESQTRVLSGVEQQLFEYTSMLVRSIAGRWPVSAIDWNKYSIAFNGDKKHGVSDYCLILPNSIGGVRVQYIPKSETTLKKIIDAQKMALSGETK
jgi:3-dehydroquinate synthase